MARVLIVEDDAQLSRAIARGLDAWYAVVEVADVAEALRALEGGGIDGIVCDWNIGEESGLELVAHVAFEFPHVRRVLMSGSTPSPMERARLYECDAEFLRKPFQMAALLAALK